MRIFSATILWIPVLVTYLSILIKVIKSTEKKTNPKKEIIIALWIIHKVYFAFTLIVPTCPQTGEKQTNASSEEENSSSN